LSATAISDVEIDLSWTNNAPAATGNRVERSLDGSTYNLVTTVPGSTTSYKDLGLAASTLYSYRVQAENQMGRSSYSNVASAKTRIAKPVLLIDDTTSQSIVLAWSRTADDHYDIARSLDGQKFDIISTVPAGTLTFSDMGLEQGTYFYRVTGANGDGDSADSNVARTTIGPISIDHSKPLGQGFQTHDELLANGNAKFVANLARLTEAANGQAGSFFTLDRVGIRGFTTEFFFRVHDGSQPPADGLTFTLQSNTPAALGGSGGALGYGGIPNSVAVKFSMFPRSETGVFAQGRTSILHDPNAIFSLEGTGIILSNQKPKHVVLQYDGFILTETIEQLTELGGTVEATHTVSYPIDIRKELGSDTGHAGFTGGTGGLNAIIDVLNWTYTENEDPDLPPRAPGNLRITDVTPHKTTSDITVRWKCNNGFTVEGFSLERSTNGVDFTEIATTDAATLTYTDLGLAAGTYYYRVRAFDDNEVFSAYSNVDSFRAGAIDHSGGFASNADLQRNGNANFVGTVARLTDGGTGQAGSVFSKARVGIGKFASSFTFQIRPGTSPMADGMTFTIQGNGPDALGPSGGGLGYGPDQPGPARGIRNSICVKFDLYDNAGQGLNSTGLFSDGRSPTIVEPGSGDVLVRLTGTGIDFSSTHVFKVDMTYNGATLSVKITDNSTMATTTNNYTVDIPAKIGSNIGFPGFTGGTGGLTAIQDVMTWTFNPM
jgi:hypothetical protein